MTMMTTEIEILSEDVISNGDNTRDIIHLQLSKAPIKDIKSKLQQYINDAYPRSFISKCTVTIQKQGTVVFVDISVETWPAKADRTKVYHLRDIWIIKSTIRNGDYCTLTYSTPQFYAGTNLSNQLLFTVTYNTTDNYQYLITSGLEIWDKDNTRKVVSKQIQRHNSDRPFSKKTGVTLLNRVFNISSIHIEALSKYLDDKDNSDELDYSLINPELAEAHQAAIDNINN